MACKQKRIPFKIKGKGPVVKKEFVPEHAFEKLTVDHGWNVELIKSDTARIILETQENLISVFDYTIADGTLSLTLQKDTLIAEAESRSIKVYYRNLSDIKASTGSSITSDEIFRNKDLNLLTEAGARLKLNIQTDSLSTKATSGSKLELSGTVQSFKGQSSSGSRLQAENLNTGNSTITASSSSKTYITVTHTLNAEIHNGGSVYYYGQPDHIERNSYTVSGKIEPQE